MKPFLALGAVILFTGVPVTVAAQEAGAPGEASVEQRTAQPGSGSTGQGIRRDAAQAKQGIKSTAREVKQGVKNGARKIKRGLKPAAHKPSASSQLRGATTAG
jgi:hypothetical protein